MTEIPPRCDDSSYSRLSFSAISLCRFCKRLLLSSSSRSSAFPSYVLRISYCNPWLRLPIATALELLGLFFFEYVFFKIGSLSSSSSSKSSSSELSRSMMPRSSFSCCNTCISYDVSILLVFCASSDGLSRPLSCLLKM